MMKNKTKMTPRTDAAYTKWQEGWDRTPFGPDFARTLERELAIELERATHYRDQWQRVNAELAAERARLDWLEDHGWITGEPCDRAAIDAAMKEETK